MRHKCFTLIFFLLIIQLGHAQTAADLFKPNTKISWLGIDYSNVKLIGDFAQIGELGEKSPSQIRNTYFPAWNELVVFESEKYDVKGMFRKEEVFYDIDMIMAVNAKTSLDGIETYNPPTYTAEDIEKFVKKYDFDGQTGIGLLFIAESLNSGVKIAYYHFVAINMATKEILISERVSGKPQGFGIKNYWAGSVHDAIKGIKGKYYKKWKSKYSGK